MTIGDVMVSIAIVLMIISIFYCWLCFRNDKLVKEKMEIEKKLETFQREMKHVSKANTAKEIRVLKKVVQNLEVCMVATHMKY